MNAEVEYALVNLEGPNTRLLVGLLLNFEVDEGVDDLHFDLNLFNLADNVEALHERGVLGFDDVAHVHWAGQLEGRCSLGKILMTAIYLNYTQSIIALTTMLLCT